MNRVGTLSLSRYHRFSPSRRSIFRQRRRWFSRSEPRARSSIVEFAGQIFHTSSCQHRQWSRMPTQN